MTERELSILDANEESFIDLLDLSILLDLLHKAKVISKRQMNFISSKQNSDSKTEALLDILRRRNLHDYWEMISCLRQSNQSNNIADVLESGGGRVCFVIYMFNKAFKLLIALSPLERQYRCHLLSVNFITWYHA